MRIRQTRIGIHAMCILGLLVVGKVQAAPPAIADPATIQQLQKQLDDLDSELALVKSAADPEAQKLAMQRHWGMMQEHMRSMWQMPGMTGGDCANWQMTDPDMTPDCPMMDHGMGSGMAMGMGPPGMMGWVMPAGVTPDAYQKQMREHMQTMRLQIAAISAETDPAKRQELMRQHYETMYRHMQAMRGMAWMWAPNAAASLPERDSKGAQLVSRYCSQCHAPPPPLIHTGKEWGEVTSRMRAHIGEQAQPAGTGVKVPSAAELDAISEYLGKHALKTRP